jgi:hypothetical protein
MEQPTSSTTSCMPCITIAPKMPKGMPIAGSLPALGLARAPRMKGRLTGFATTRTTAGDCREPCDTVIAKGALRQSWYWLHRLKHVEYTCLSGAAKSSKCIQQQAVYRKLSHVGHNACRFVHPDFSSVLLGRTYLLRAAPFLGKAFNMSDRITLSSCFVHGLCIMQHQ